MPHLQYKMLFIPLALTFCAVPIGTLSAQSPYIDQQWIRWNGSIYDFTPQIEDSPYWEGATLVNLDTWLAITVWCSASTGGIGYEVSLGAEEGDSPPIDATMHLEVGTKTFILPGIVQYGKLTSLEPEARTPVWPLQAAFVTSLLTSRNFAIQELTTDSKLAIPYSRAVGTMKSCRGGLQRVAELCGIVSTAGSFCSEVFCPPEGVGALSHFAALAELAPNELFPQSLEKTIEDASDLYAALGDDGVFGYAELICDAER